MTTAPASSSTQSISSDNQENLLKRLIQAHNEENLTLFIGAGISKCIVGSTAMIWDEAVAKMQEILNLKENDPLRLAQLFYQQLPEKYNEFVHSMIDSSVSPSAVHTMIAQLHPKIIITTNWDCLIEQAVVNALLFYDVITCDEELLCSKSPYKIIKMHGDFARSDNRFVFKEDDYLNYSQNYPFIETFIKNVLITSKVLFLGYSYSDINLKMIMTWLKQNKNKTNLPLYVMAEFTENQSQIKYLQNWGVETYICKNISEKSKTQNLPIDEQDRARKIYTLLECINNEILNINDVLGNLVNKIEPYLNLPAVPISLVTSLITGSEIRFIDNSNLTLDLSNTSQDIATRLLEQLKTNDESKEKQKFLSFIKKAGIINIVNNYFLDNFLYFNSLFDNSNIKQNYLDDIEDIKDFLSFKNVSLDDKYDIIFHNRTIRDSLKNGNIPTAFIEIFNLKTYEYLFNSQKFFPSQNIKIEDAFDNLPNNIRTIYKTFIQSIKLENLQLRTTKLYKSIENEKSNIASNIPVFNYIDFSSRADHLNFLRFVWLNHLYVDNYQEVNEYVFRSVELFKHLSISHQIPIHLSKFELSSMLHFLTRTQFNMFYSINSFNSQSQFNFEIDDEDIKWLIQEVLPNLFLQYNKIEKDNKIDKIQFNSLFYNKILDIDYAQRIGNTFIILSSIKQIEFNYLNEIIDYIIDHDFLFNANFGNSLNIALFFKTHQTIIKECQHFNTLIQKINNKLKEYINKPNLNIQQIQSLLEFLVSFQSDRILFSIDKQIIDIFIPNFLSLSFQEKCHFLLIINFLLQLSPESIKQKMKDILKNDILKIDEKNPPIQYYVYKAYFMLLDILPIESQFLIEIRTSKTIHDALEKDYNNNDIAWLINYLNQILNYNPYLNNSISKEIKLTLESLVFKHPNPSSVTDSK